MYHDTPTTAASVTKSPSRSAGVGDRPSRVVTSSPNHSITRRANYLRRGDDLRGVPLRVFRGVKKQPEDGGPQPIAADFARLVQRAERRRLYVGQRAIDRGLR